ncbi:MAG: cytochrome P450 [Acidimicrobiales bacterium]|nr:cytochrome P450 [Acidimicrobiales bacterium]
MASRSELQLDPVRLKELFDLSGEVYATRGGAFDVDINPIFNALREQAPVHEGIAGEMAGFQGEVVFEGLPYPDRRHFTAFDYDNCDTVLRDTERFTPQPQAHADGVSFHETTMLYMEGDQHRSYRMLEQPSFVPKRAQWWIDQWIRATVEGLLDNLQDKGRADLNVEFCAPIPLLTICGSFGVSVADALDIRAAVTSDGLGLERFAQIVMPIVKARRADPGDDLVSVLVQAELTEPDGTRHVLSDEEVFGFAFLLLAAGSGTTWKQMGITLMALLEHPEWIERIRQDPTVLRAVIEESVRWMPTDPVFARFVRDDTELGGVHMPAGSVIHTCLSSANRDPSRWDRPDEFDPARPMQTHLAFGSGPHVCLGMHVARAEITTAVGAIIERLPNLRADPDAPLPRMIGMYERGPDAVPVVWG